MFQYTSCSGTSDGIVHFLSYCHNYLLNSVSCMLVWKNGGNFSRLIPGLCSVIEVGVRLTDVSAFVPSWFSVPF